MEVKGRVTALDGGTATIEIKRKPACSGCGKSCSHCLSTGEDTIMVRTANTRNAALGDIVELEAPDSRILGYAVMVFILPIAAGLGLFALSWWLSGGSSAISYSVSGASFISSILVIYSLMNRAASKKENFKMK